ncbi:MAG TPA: hypothetical protein GXX75_02625 [Clostridiales bacterium]|nr:hypothetical protein [Clostridiales bacterium]
MEELSCKLKKIKEKCKERFKPAVMEIEQRLSEKDRKRIVVAIDGKCGSGKTTLGLYLQGRFDCNLFHMDDFFLQNHQRTAARSEEAGGNVDYERFKAEVLEPLLSGGTVRYRSFNCITRVIDREWEVPPKRLNIVEGSYSQHPYFGNPYDLCIFLDIDDLSQIENIRNRNGEEKLKLFQREWIPKENRYFNEFKIKEKSLVIHWN